MSNYDGNYLYWNCFENSIYQLDRDLKISEKYRITEYFNASLPGPDFYLERHDLTSSKVSDEIYEKKLVYSQRFIENENNLVAFYFAGGVKTSVINKTNKKQKHSSSLVDDFGLCLNIKNGIMPIYHQKGKVVFNINSIEFQIKIESGAKHTDFHPVFSDYDINSNPVLVVFTLKEDIVIN